MGAHKALEVKICLFLHFPSKKTTIPSVAFEWKTGEQTDGKPPAAPLPFGEQ